MNCPQCGQPLQYHSQQIPEPGQLFTKILPIDGDITWCGSCGVILVFDSMYDPETDTRSNYARILRTDEIEHLQLQVPGFYARCVEISMLILQEINN